MVRLKTKRAGKNKVSRRVLFGVVPFRQYCIFLFQEIGEIASYSFVKMHHVFSHHIVPLVWISEIVALHSRIFASTKESECMLRHTNRVVVAVDDL